MIIKQNKIFILKVEQKTFNKMFYSSFIFFILCSVSISSILVIKV